MDNEVVCATSDLNMSEVLRGERLLSLMMEYVVYGQKIRGLTKATLKGKRNALLRFHRWLDGRSFNLDSAEKYLDWLMTESKSNNTCREYFKTIRAFCGWLDRRKNILYFLKPLELPRADEVEKRIPTHEGALKVIQAGSEPCRSDNKRGRKSKEESRSSLTFMLYTGCRDGGTLALRIEDIDFSSNQYTIRNKGGKMVTKGMPVNMIPVLEEIINGRTEGKVWNVTAETLRKVLKRGCLKLGVPIIKPHDLRKCFATTLAEAGMSPDKLMNQLNHEKFETTRKFYIAANVRKQADDLNLTHPGITSGMPTADRLEVLGRSQLVQSFASDSRFRVIIEPGRLVVEVVGGTATN